MGIYEDVKRLMKAIVEEQPLLPRRRYTVHHPKCELVVGSPESNTGQREPFCTCGGWRFPRRG